MGVNVIVGLQRGDEGKGRFVDMLAEEHDIVARFNGGNNAGHTVVLPDGRELALHLVPSGVAHPGVMNIIGNGTLVNPIKLAEEMADIKSKGIEISPQNLKISSASHLILPHHVYDDVIREKGENGQGSTKSGIAQVASCKALRIGARTEIIKSNPDRLGELVEAGLEAQRPLREAADIEPINAKKVAREYVKSAKKLSAFITDTVYYLNRQLHNEKPARVLAEGAQAYWLDIDHGMYPFTTSSSTTTGGVCTGLGVPPHCIENVIGIAKAVQSHVGGGPFVTEIYDKEVLKRLHGDMTKIDAEKGTTTGRKRRLGYLDLPQIRRAQMVNAPLKSQTMALSKLDWVSRFGEETLICVAYRRKGKILKVAPDAAYKLEECDPVYESLPTWKDNIQDVRGFEDLPKEARDLINFIEKNTGVPITMIGVGPCRDQAIIR